jgi:phosphodiesterase/alkaline phosphatase D-like protein
MRKIVLVSLAVSMVVVAAAWAATTPTVVTGAANGVTNAGALLHASVNPEGSGTTYVFEYGLTAQYGSMTSAGNAGFGTKLVSVHSPAAGLNPGTVYHYRVDARNKLGAAFGMDRTLTTTGHPLPGAITGLPSVINTTTATLTGTVVTQNETTTFLFEYGPTPSYGLQTTSTDATASLAPTGVSQALSNLSPGTTFHYRLVANHAGTAAEFGADQTFTTIPLVRFHARVTAHTTPVHARHKPYLFTTIGKVVAPASLPAAAGCTGFVSVRFLLGHRTVAFRKPPLQANCTFSTQALFGHLVQHRKTQLRVVARFGGNSYLGSARARGQRVRLG